MTTDTVERKCPCNPNSVWCNDHDCCTWDCWDFANDQHKPIPEPAAS